ncbi:unnamed protein product, partial [Vitis vinifera]|uniref:Uncharacterized protein n=1 Tax=Vitis vinifera TaxID=29760 RepID=D7TSI3_VITVI
MGVCRLGLHIIVLSPRISKSQGTKVVSLFSNS